MEKPAPFPAAGRIAGIDYGTVRIGVAITDPSQTLASPLENYTRRTEALDAAWFTSLAKEERIAGFVVGLPVHVSGQESAKSLEARRFGEWLGRTTSLPVCYFDERYSSAQAEQLLGEAGLTKKRRRARLDKLAAQLFLTAFLEAKTAGNVKQEPQRLDG
jgi:putative Holliday junction resolvase